MRRLGDITLDRVVEMEEPMVEAAVFLPESTPDVFAAHAHWLQPQHVCPQTGRLNVTVQSHIVRTGRYTILVDACVGNDKNRADHRASWHERQGPFLDDLAAAGVRPEAVDFVLCTHLHTDHVGWNTRLVNGRWVPTFPNAKYIFSRTEYETWEKRYAETGPVGHQIGYEDSVLPVMQAKQAVLVEMDHQIDHGVWFEPAPGHTAGNVVVNLKSGDAHAVLAGDVIHHPVQLVRPDWSSRACEDRAMSRKTRRALLERYADTSTLLAPAHFHSPGVGRIVTDGDHFGWRPVED